MKTLERKHTICLLNSGSTSFRSKDSSSSRVLIFSISNNSWLETPVFLISSWVSKTAFKIFASRFRIISFCFSMLLSLPKIVNFFYKINHSFQKRNKSLSVLRFSLVYGLYIFLWYQIHRKISRFQAHMCTCA